MAIGEEEQRHLGGRAKSQPLLQEQEDLAGCGAQVQGGDSLQNGSSDCKPLLSIVGLRVLRLHCCSLAKPTMQLVPGPQEDC